MAPNRLLHPSLHHPLTTLLLCAGLLLSGFTSGYQCQNLTSPRLTLLDVIKRSLSTIPMSDPVQNDPDVIKRSLTTIPVFGPPLYEPYLVAIELDYNVKPSLIYSCTGVMLNDNVVATLYEPCYKDRDISRMRVRHYCPDFPRTTLPYKYFRTLSSNNKVLPQSAAVQIVLFQLNPVEGDEQCRPAHNASLPIKYLPYPEEEVAGNVTDVRVVTFGETRYTLAAVTKTEPLQGQVYQDAMLYVANPNGYKIDSSDQGSAIISASNSSLVGLLSKTYDGDEGESYFVAAYFDESIKKDVGKFLNFPESDRPSTTPVPDPDLIVHHVDWSVLLRSLGITLGIFVFVSSVVYAWLKRDYLRQRWQTWRTNRQRPQGHLEQQGEGHQLRATDESAARPLLGETDDNTGIAETSLTDPSHSAMATPTTSSDVSQSLPTATTQTTDLSAATTSSNDATDGTTVTTNLSSTETKNDELESVDGALETPEDEVALEIPKDEALPKKNPIA